ncbi:MAG: ATP-binding protein [Candidatus Parcubacteria bacterium]|nr:ATP-binding protein [Candidatus Parcubacteria bacterium]
MYIKRYLEDLILKYLDKPEIIAIVGPRQCGKTTLLKEIAEKVSGDVFISFEDQSILSLFNNNLDDFINIYVKGKKYIFIDEFQYAKDGGKKLKYIFDHFPIKIFISGSSSIDLTVKVLKYLVGRIFIFNLYPLNFLEILSYKDKNYYDYLKEKQGIFWKNFETEISPEAHQKLMNFYEEYLIYGGYPRVVISSSIEEKKEVLKNIYNTYFLREVKDILGLIDDYKLSNLIKGLALQIGNLVSYNELSDLSGYDYLSLKKYLGFIQKTFVADLIKPYFNNKRLEIVKTPKVYFYDTGLRNAVINDFRPLDERTDAGALLENGVFQQLTKTEYTYNFWHSKQKAEIDFVINLGQNKKLALEVKNKAQILSSSIFKKYYPEIKLFVLYRKIASQTLLDNHPIYII